VPDEPPADGKNMEKRKKNKYFNIKLINIFLSIK
jgi:hypothetical protein